MAHEEPRKQLSATQARQGARGTHLFKVLVGALLLAAIVWVGLEVWGRYIEPGKAGGAISSEGLPAGTSQNRTIENNAAAGQPVQPAPTDRSEIAQQGINSTPAQPSRNGVQN